MELRRAGAVLRAAALYAELLGEGDVPVSELFDVSESAKARLFEALRGVRALVLCSAC